MVIVKETLWREEETERGGEVVIEEEEMSSLEAELNDLSACGKCGELDKGQLQNKEHGPQS